MHGDLFGGEYIINMNADVGVRNEEDTHMGPMGSLLGILCDRICFSINKIERDKDINIMYKSS